MPERARATRAPRQWNNGTAALVAARPRRLCSINAQGHYRSGAECGPNVCQPGRSWADCGPNLAESGRNRSKIGRRRPILPIPGRKRLSSAQIWQKWAKFGRFRTRLAKVDRFRAKFGRNGRCLAKLGPTRARLCQLGRPDLATSSSGFGPILATNRAAFQEFSGIRADLIANHTARPESDLQLVPGLTDFADPSPGASTSSPRRAGARGSRCAR